MIRALIFDMDGLMIDTEHLYWEVGRAIAKEFGKTVSDETLRQTMGRDRLESCRILVEGAGISLTPQQMMSRREAMMLEKLKQGIQPMRGLREILNQFSGKLKLAVGTSAPRMLASAALGSLGVEKFFAAIITGDEVAKGKPEPDIYLNAMQKLGVQPAESIVLEDAPAGALAGHRAGAYVIAVPSPLTVSEDFSAIANARVKDLTEAAAQIQSLISSFRKADC